jgi:hypothetical protein
MKYIVLSVRKCTGSFIAQTTLKTLGTQLVHEKEHVLGEGLLLSWS